MLGYNPRKGQNLPTKKSTDQLQNNKSPYFASLRRKSKMAPNQALSITKCAPPDESASKKKVFKRLSKFEVL